MHIIRHTKNNKEWKSNLPVSINVPNFLSPRARPVHGINIPLWHQIYAPSARSVFILTIPFLSYLYLSLAYLSIESANPFCWITPFHHGGGRVTWIEKGFQKAKLLLLVSKFILLECESLIHYLQLGGWFEVNVWSQTGVSVPFLTPL